MNRFDRDTTVEPLEEGVYEARIDRGWWIVQGPNGGYIGAILLRALEAAVGDPARAPRSLTVHFTAPPAEGKARIATRLERVGRSLTTATARMEQDGRLLALALAAFSKPREGPDFQHGVMPEVPAPESVPSFTRGPAIEIPMHARYDSRWVIGDPPRSSSPEALAGGWIRLVEPRPLDAPLLVAYADAWPPAVFSWAAPGVLTGGVPTIDLTVHFRAPLPPPGPTDAFALVAFRTRTAREGFLEEDGEIWSADGTLLAQSRQLAIFL